MRLSISLPVSNPGKAAPAIILVRPQLGENIGAVARAMSNFGLSDLRLVAPKNGWPNPRAYDMAVSASPLLDRAQLYATLPEAMHDISVAYATTARTRDMAKPQLVPAETALALRRAAEQGQRAALLFGPERTGLTNEETVLADGIVTIPTAPDHASLNLSQAMVILGYEWFTRGAITSDIARGAVYPPATKQEVESFFTQLEEYLDAVDYFRTAQKKTLMWQNLRTIFVRAAMNEQELRSVRGVIRALYARRKE
ncbi:MAG: RNA methyltransferase [Alphaproteobacteria bacterium]|nr:RNA methyltransferase [Alphaproteobacteria bacterium]